MPDNCLNHLMCEERQAAKLRKLFLDENNKKTFKIVCPMPECLLKISSLGGLEDEVELVRKELAGEPLTQKEKASLDQELEEDDGSKTTHRAHALLALQAKEETGHIDWYGWALANWGTKWEPYSTFFDENEELEAIEELDADPTFYEFFTAWSPPDKFYEMLSQHVDFEAYYAETGAKFSGKFYARNGELQNEYYEYDQNPKKYIKILELMDIYDGTEEEL
jgi:hypothetical protein